MSPCNPTHPLAQCGDCARYRPELPHCADMRPGVVCLDVAAVLAEGSACPMFAVRAVHRYWWQPTAQHEAVA